MDINNEVNKNKIISEDDSKTKNLIEKRIKKYKSRLPESYWSETSWAIRTKPPKKRLNPMLHGGDTICTHTQCDALLNTTRQNQQRLCVTFTRP